MSPVSDKEKPVSQELVDALKTFDSSFDFFSFEWPLKGLERVVLFVGKLRVVFVIHAHLIQDFSHFMRENAGIALPCPDFVEVWHVDLLETGSKSNKFGLGCLETESLA